ncbi:hypothetical protein HK100_003233 [Physocladia obscura]|uniref:Uncharacterized protein n=1 Tax=Physocladia obscura TaxID=109957 RepID=A0AAD5T092_9FUNG|nr:hypothetical protein HK100_003233 [Physocladia obscura]
MVDEFEESWKRHLAIFKEGTKLESNGTGRKPREPSAVTILIEMFGRGFFPIGIIPSINQILS